MRKSMEELDLLIKAGISCIWIKTYEESEVIKDILEVVRNGYKSYPVYSWSMAEGCRKLALQPTEKDGELNRQLMQPNAIMEAIAASSGRRSGEGAKSIYILKDFQEPLCKGSTQAVIRRHIRDLKESKSPVANVIICVSPQVELPSDVSKLFRVLDYDLPEVSDIEGYVRGAAQQLVKMADKDNSYVPVAEEVITNAVNACRGMTKKEIMMALSESIVRKHTIDVDFLLVNKIQEVKKTGILDYKIPEMTLDDIGGNRAIKDWLMEQKELFAPEAREFGLPMPKGYVSVGIPGCAKTALAEAFAGMMNVPLLSLSMAKIMSKHVGESESKIEYAIQVAKSCAPCVLLMDEIEKMLGSAGAGGSSNQVDGGVTNRVFQSLLKFMNDNDSGVYVIMTSNDVSQLPPEFTRAGRVDAHWYFGLPKAAEREDILNIHFSKFNKTLPADVMKIAVDNTEGYTGAELKTVVANCMRKAFIRHKNNPEQPVGFTQDEVLESIHEVIPVSESSKEKIAALEMWCTNRARRSDYEEEKVEVANEDLPMFGGMFSM